MTVITAASAEAVRACAPEYDHPRWRTDAACKGMDIDIFFPHPSGPAQFDQARVICSGCPVRVECLHDSLTSGFAWLDDGFRGGKTPRERQELRGRVRYQRSTCAVCLRSFVGPETRTARYCSQACRNVMRAARMRKARAS